MSISNTLLWLKEKGLPSPFTLAVLLSFLTYILALTCTPAISSDTPKWLAIAGYWQDGFWDLSRFTMQMMLILVLGHIIALTKPVAYCIERLVRLCHTTARATFVVCLVSMLLGFLNWGLALIVASLLAREVGAHAKTQQRTLNYPLVAASAYSCMMVWHGGLSGSAPLKVNESGHFMMDLVGVVSLNDTLFSTLNLTICALLLVIVPLGMAWAGHKRPEDASGLANVDINKPAPPVPHEVHGAEKLEYNTWLARGFGLIFLGMAFYSAGKHGDIWSLQFLTLDFMNFTLFGLGLLLLGTHHRFQEAVDEAISGSTGILIQFPLYAGIAGMMFHSGLVDVLSEMIASHATADTFGLWVLASASLVNMFVPSGGGQWAVQGPIVMEAAQQLGVNNGYAVMAFSYGDQLTNMCQPFWALPLLAITGVSAKAIFPYTLRLLLLGSTIFAAGLYFLA